MWIFLTAYPYTCTHKSVNLCLSMPACQIFFSQKVERVGFCYMLWSTERLSCASPFKWMAAADGNAFEGPHSFQKEQNFPVASASRKWIICSLQPSSKIIHTPLTAIFHNSHWSIAARASTNTLSQFHCPICWYQRRGRKPLWHFHEGSLKFFERFRMRTVYWFTVGGRDVL